MSRGEHYRLDCERGLFPEQRLVIEPRNITAPKKARKISLNEYWPRDYKVFFDWLIGNVSRAGANDPWAPVTCHSGPQTLSYSRGKQKHVNLDSLVDFVHLESRKENRFYT